MATGACRPTPTGRASFSRPRADLTKSQTELEMWERRVSSLRTSRLDPDSVDERARATLNLADPADIIGCTGPGKRLF